MHAWPLVFWADLSSLPAWTLYLHVTLVQMKPTIQNRDWHQSNSLSAAISPACMLRGTARSMLQIKVLCSMVCCCTSCMFPSLFGAHAFSHGVKPSSLGSFRHSRNSMDSGRRQLPLSFLSRAAELVLLHLQCRSGRSQTRATDRTATDDD